MSPTAIMTVFQCWINTRIKERDRIRLSLLKGKNRKIKGVQPVGLAISPDLRYLYVAEAGINAIGVIKLDGKSGDVVGHIPNRMVAQQPRGQRRR